MHAAERRRHPREDLLTKLVEAQVGGERLSETDVVNFAKVLLLAGHITTTLLLGNTVLCLGREPEQAPLARLEGRVALNILMDRFPGLRTDPDAPPQFQPNPAMTGVRTLPLLVR